MKKERSRLYIPTKILDSDDYVQGFGRTELSITGVVLVIAACVGIALFQINGSTAQSVMCAFGIVGITIVLIRRDMCNENVFQKIRILWKNNTMQKRFLYHYHNIYEDIRDE